MDLNLFRPVLLSSETRIEDIYLQHPNSFFVDAFERQLKELFFIDYDNFIGEPKNEVYNSEEFLNYQKNKSDDFVYIYYPWNQTIVKSVKEDDYFKLKTNRNQDLITAEEQKKLYNYKVAVFGMSVGSNIAFVLTQAGISKDIVLADFDELDTTNLNRIWAGVHQVGLNKAVIAARRIYEDNPYANVTLLIKGVTPANLKKLLESGKIDCIVEEIDNVSIKVEIRKLAFKYKKPVLMITDNGDGIVLHVERYDLGYDKMFGKSFDDWDIKISKIKSPIDIGNLIVNEILGGIEKVDSRVLQSVQRVFKKELISWSQLGSAALLGGVVSTYMIKKIALNENNEKYIEKSVFPL